MYSNVERNRKELFVDYIIPCKVLGSDLCVPEYSNFWDVTTCRMVNRLVTFKNGHSITPEERLECSNVNY